MHHHGKEKRKQYISRHRPNANWNDYTSAGSLTCFILWERWRINAAIHYYIAKESE